MPTPFMCHWCDKPTMNETGICIECEQKYEEGNKELAATVRELETRIRWLEDGLKEVMKISKNMNISSDESRIVHIVQSTLDGEPTTADKYNAKAKLELEKVNRGLDTMKEDEKLVYEDDFIQYRDTGDENIVRISDVNKEIAKEWDRDREKKINMITSIGYRGED